MLLARGLLPVLLWALPACAGAVSASPASQGASLNSPGPDGETPLTAAVRHSRLDLVKSLLAHGADPNVGGGEGSKPPLLIAINLGNTDMVQALIDAKADVQGKDPASRSYLLQATQDVRIMALLVAAGAPVNPASPQEWSPLDSAAGADHKDRAAFDFLLAHGAEIKPGTYSANTALTKAVEMGNLSIAETLLERGVNPNHPHTFFEDAPLIMAVLEVDFPDTTVPMIELLLRHGADVNLRDDSGTTPLGWISGGPSYRPSLQIAALLLDHGADVNIANDQRVTPLIAAVSGHQQEVVRLLLAHGARTGPRDWSGDTALSTAAYRYSESIPRAYPDSVALIKTLIGGGADVRGGDGGRALVAAAASRNGGALMALLDAGAPINCRLEHDFYGGRILQLSEPNHRRNGPPGLTALMYAAANGDLDMVRMLLARGARIDERDTLGRTALMHAVWYGHDGIVAELLARGADPRTVSSLGETPEKIARRRDVPRLARVLARQRSPRRDLLNRRHSR